MGQPAFRIFVGFCFAILMMPFTFQRESDVKPLIYDALD